MTDRSVNVKLRADVADFVRNTEAAAKAVKGLGDASKDAEKDVEKSSQKRMSLARQELAAYKEAEARAKQAAAAQKEALSTVGTAATAAGVAITGIVAVAVKTYAEFDAMMATVAADTRETGEALGQLRAAAIKAGADTSFSATEAAQAIDELAKAGVSTADILGGGLNGALALASAGGLEVAEAAETAATALVQFKLGGEDVGHVADLLAAGAGKAQGSVHDLGMGLKQGGLVAAQFGISVEDTVGTLAAFASAGLIGSDAGTSFKTMLLALANPSKEAAAAMEQYNIHAYDAQGNFVGLTSLAGQLQAGLSGATQAQRDQALATIFGTDAIRSANVLYNQGADGLQEWINRTNDAGYAAETSAIKLDSLAGDWEYLTGSIDSAFLNSGSTINDFLRGAVQAAEEVVDAYNALPEPIQSGALALGGIGGAGLLAAGGLAIMVPKVLETIEAVNTLRDSNTKMAGTLGKVGAVAGVATAALAALTVAGALADDGADPAAVSEYVRVLGDLSQGATGATEKLNVLFESGKYSADSFGEALKVTGGGFQGFMAKADDLANFWHGSYLDQATAGVENMDQALKTLVDSGSIDTARGAFQQLAEQANEQGITVDELKERFPEYSKALEEATSAQEEAAPSAEELASQITGVGTSGEEAADAVDTLSETLDALLSQFFSVDQAADDFQGKLNALSGAAKDNGKDLEGTTDKAIANREALRASADAAANLILKMAEQGSSSEELAAKAGELKTQFLEQAAAAGFTGGEVDKVAAAYDAIPEAVRTELLASGLDETQAKLAGIIRQINTFAGRTFTTYVDVKQTGNVGGQRAGLSVASANGNLLDFYANGGVAEDHVAQIAPAGAWRVWAEPETEGEAYVPLAASKRERSKSIVEEVVNRFDGAVHWFADGGLSGNVLARAAGQLPGTYGGAGAASSTSTTAGARTDPSSFAITTGSILSGLTASDAAPGAAAGYAAALDAAAAAAGRLAKAEDTLEVLRERASRRLENMKTVAAAAEEAQKAAQDAAIEKAEEDLKALKRRNDDALDALKTRNDAELDAFKAKSKNQAAIKALQQRQDDAEKALARRNDDEEEAANDRIADAKKANTAAAKELKKANDALYDRAQANAAKEEAGATDKLKAAKDADAEASRAAAEAERLLNEQRAKAQQLAEQTANAIRKNATLTGALSDNAPGALRAAGVGLSEASTAADAAARAKRDESAADAATRRAAALDALAKSATTYASAQRAMGVGEVAIAANLDQVAAKLADLGKRYGLTTTEVGKLTGQLDEQRTSVDDVLSSFDRQKALAAEFSTSITALQNMGLGKDLLDQVIGGGTTDGLRLARLLLAGGGSSIGRANSTQASLDLYANAAGSQVAAARYGSSIYSPTYVSGGVTAATLSPDAVAVLGQVATAIASRPLSVIVNGREVFLAMSDAAAAQQYATAG